MKIKFIDFCLNKGQLLQLQNLIQDLLELWLNHN